MLGAERHPKVVQEYLRNYLQAGCIVPVPPRWCANVHLSRFGVIPKKRQPGKWRLIVDLSSPDGESVNDFIDTSVCSLKIASVDDAAEFVLRHSASETAYRNIQVYPGEASTWKVAADCGFIFFRRGKRQ